MKRSTFLKLLPAAITAVTVAPKLLVPKEPARINPLQIYKPKNLANQLTMIRHKHGVLTPPNPTPQVQLKWIDKAEYDFQRQFIKDREIAYMQFHSGMINLETLLNKSL